MAENRDLLVGTTVILTVATSLPGSRTPATPSEGVQLEALYRRGTPNVAVDLPEDVEFTEKSTGQWVLNLETAGFQPGVYIWRAKAVDLVLGTALREDHFVLSAASG